MPGATIKRGHADGQRFMLVGAICTRYGECQVRALHTCGHSKSTWRAKPTYPIYGNADACLRDDRMGMATLVWGWRVVESVPWYRSSRPLALFSLTLNPLTSLTPFHVREFRLAFG